MMESFEIKITIRELAKRSGTSKDTVMKYLKKIDYKGKK
jgi:DNA-binding MurR/RpiR family transcriptional regulator